MCFSASASFGVSAVLMATGLVSLKKTQLRSQIPFAAIPIIFSIQQFIEGLLWLSLTNSNYISWHKPATNIFLIFAQVVWPIWVPLSMMLLEQDVKRKKIISTLLSIGIVISAYLSFCILNYRVDSSIKTHHIHYDLDFPHYNLLINLSGVFYFIPTVIPGFVSSVKKMNIIAITLLASFIFTKIFYAENVISVWCFFAAPISIIVLYIIAAIQVPGKLSKSIT